MTPEVSPEEVATYVVLACLAFGYVVWCCLALSGRIDDLDERGR